MNNNLLLRRYAVQLGNKQGLPASMLERPLSLHEVKNAQVHPSVGQPIHRVLHQAMADAFHHLGLGRGGGEEQYQAFSNLRDRANKELSNPNSKFTKLLDKHKSELSQVPNPREHLTDALLPLFHNLSQDTTSRSEPKASETASTQGEEVPTHEEAPIDLLGSGHHHPFEKDEDNRFEYKPRLPSGFVEVPHPDHNPEDWSLEHPQPKPKRNITPVSKRKEIYQTIAHSLANRENVHEALNREHGLNEQEANKHYQNYLKNKKKPEGKIRPENQIKPKGGKRRTRKFSKDLMEIPVKYSKDEQCHEITLDEEEPPAEEPVKHSAFRAPAGGAIVRGSQYSGGQMIPDLGGSFVNPRRKAIKKNL